MLGNAELRRHIKLTKCISIGCLLATWGHTSLAQTETHDNADSEKPATNFFTRAYLIDNNQHWRANLAEETGINIVANYSIDVMGNPVGGQANKLRYSTLGFFGLDIDLGTLAKEKWLDGWSVYAAGYNAEGKNLANDIGNAIQPSTLFSGVVPVGLAQAYISWQDEHVKFDLGRLTPEDYFASSPLWDYFVSLAYNDNPWNLSASNPNFTGAPGTLWMIEGEWQFDPQWKISAGLANTSQPDLTAPSNRGVDFHFDPLDGTLFMAELAHEWETLLFDSRSVTGSVQVGGYYDTAQFQRLTRPRPGVSPTKSGLAAAWVILEQQFIPGSNPGDVGLTGWVLGSWTGPDSIANSPWFFSTGMVYEGILPSRPSDALAFGYSINWFNEQLAGQNHESNLELTYLIQVTPWLSIQPDLQYIMDPNGLNTIDDALVIGFQCAVTF